MKILYLMHTSWGWIKQRPHFFAEKLSQYFQVDVYSRANLKTQRIERESVRPQEYLRIFPLYLMGHLSPKLRYNKFAQWIYRFWVRAQIKDFETYDIIWVTNVIFYKFIRKMIKSHQQLIYDCMDDDLEFPHIKKDENLKKYYMCLEKELISRADMIFFSSDYLRRKVSQRSNYRIKNSYVINNAVELPKFDVYGEIINRQNDDINEILDYIKTNRPCVVYIGTVSEWFDFDLIIKMLENNAAINIIIFGPADIEIPKHKQIHYMGKVKRDAIFSIMSVADALIMPFKINELIRSVNPVKLYEYLYSGKPVIAPMYEEMEQFKEYVYTYENMNQFEMLCSAISQGKLKSKCDKAKCIEFIKNNTWDTRMKTIVNVISNSVKEI